MDPVGTSMSVAMGMITVIGMKGCSERPEREPVREQVPNVGTLKFRRLRWIRKPVYISRCCCSVIEGESNIIRDAIRVHFRIHLLP